MRRPRTEAGEDAVLLRTVRAGRGGGRDLISPQQDLDSTLGLSQHNCRGREIKRESWNESKDWGWGGGGRMEEETLSFSVNSVPNNPFLMNPLLPSPNRKHKVTSFISTSCFLSSLLPALTETLKLKHKRGSAAAPHRRVLTERHAERNNSEASSQLQLMDDDTRGRPAEITAQEARSHRPPPAGAKWTFGVSGGLTRS